MDTQILITNDDGIASPALKALEVELSPLGRLTVVAPDREMSATSHSITLNRPLRFHQVAANRFSVDGTPADCVILAFLRILETRPHLLVSGINRGKNVGDSVAYSGTLAAAFEGALQGIPGIAVSLEYREPMDFKPAAEFTAVLAHRVLEEGLPPGVVLNVNFPTVWNGRVLLTRQGQNEDRTVLVENLDPRGEQYFWLHEELHDHNETPSEEHPADYEALQDGYASVTPLQVDRTAFRFFKPLSNWIDIFDVSSTSQRQGEQDG